jgi:hypothetical protein
MGAAINAVLLSSVPNQARGILKGCATIRTWKATLGIVAELMQPAVLRRRKYFTTLATDHR